MCCLHNHLSNNDSFLIDFLEDDSEEDAPKKQELERNTNMNDAVDANDYDVKKRLDKVSFYSLFNFFYLFYFASKQITFIQECLFE